MSIFSDYLKDKPEEERAAFERIISLVKKHVPDAEEGLSYGFPAFRLSGFQISWKTVHRFWVEQARTKHIPF